MSSPTAPAPRRATTPREVIGRWSVWRECRLHQATSMRALKIATASLALLVLSQDVVLAADEGVPCPQPGSRTVRADSHAIIYRLPSGGLYGCAYGSGELRLLGFDATYYRPPVMALSGTMAAVVINNPAFDDYPSIKVVDLGPGGYAREVRQSGGARRVDPGTS